jgi:hypothetical protein
MGIGSPAVVVRLLPRLRLSPRDRALAATLPLVCQKVLPMLKAILTIVALVAFAGAALAKCPPGKIYQCHQGFNGKIVCACK